MTWQPIATAPKDGTAVLLYIAEEDAVIEGWWFSSPKQIDDGWETVIGFWGEPTYWMPRLEPPLDVEAIIRKAVLNMMERRAMGLDNPPSDLPS